MVIGVVGAGVARPQDARQHLPPAGDQQRMEAEPALVVAGRHSLSEWAVIGVASKSSTTRSGAAPAPHARCPARARARRISQARLTDREHHPPRRRYRGDLTEQRRLASQRGQIREAPPAVGAHHRQIAEHPARVMPTTPLARSRKRSRKRFGQAEPPSHQRQQRRPRPRRQARAVRPHIYGPETATSHHLQGEPPERGERRLDTAILPAQADVSAPAANPRPTPH